MSFQHKSDFCVIILSHGRPQNQDTVATLKRFGYTGDWLILLDNEDDTVDQYIKNYGSEHIRIFDKQAIMDSGKVDSMDNFKVHATVVYARYASYGLAQLEGYKYFMMCEDDHDSVRWRMDETITYSSKMLSERGETLNKVIDVMLDYFIAVPRIKTLCMAQSGDYIGGGNSKMATDQFRRKAMGTFIVRSDEPIHFTGTMNDDTNAYTTEASIGELMLTTGFIAVNTKPTQKNKGGNTDIYAAFGTYVKSFYSVIGHPSGVKISTLANNGDRVKNDIFRIHHRVTWKNVAPRIIRQNSKKSLTT